MGRHSTRRFREAIHEPLDLQLPEEPAMEVREVSYVAISGSEMELRTIRVDRLDIFEQEKLRLSLKLADAANQAGIYVSIEATDRGKNSQFIDEFSEIPDDIYDRLNRFGPSS